MHPDRIVLILGMIASWAGLAFVWRSGYGIPVVTPLVVLSISLLYLTVTLSKNGP